MSAARRRFSQEVKNELCMEVVATSQTIKEVAVDYAVGAETTRKWLNKWGDAHGGTDTEWTLTELAWIKELEQCDEDLRAKTAK